MASPQFNYADGGTNGTTPAVTDTGSGDALGVVTAGPNSICQYSNAHPGHGTLGYKLANNTATAESNFIGQLDAGGGAASVFGSFTYLCDVTPTSSLRVTMVRKNAAGIAGGIWHSTGNLLQIRHGNDSLAHAFTNAMTPGTKYRIEWEVVVNGTTSATLQVRLYLMDSNTLIEDSGAIAITASAAVSAIDLIRYGGGATSTATWPAATGAQYFDDLKIFFPSWATLISNVPATGTGLVSGAVWWCARITKTVYNNSTYNIGSSNDAPWCEADHVPTPFSLFSQHATKQPPAIHWGGPGTGIGTFDSTAEGDARTLGCFSAYSMSPSVGELTDLLNGTNTSNGLTNFDALINAIKTSGKPILFRPCWEMNANYTSPFAWQRANFTSAQYVTIWKNMWQRCADIMGGHAAGSGLGTDTGNMSWFWCPQWVDGSTGLDPTPWFPGTKYVDVVGADGYNENTTNSPSTIFDTVLGTCRTLAPGKPVAIGETGCPAPTSYTGGKSQWITDLFAYVKAHTDIVFVSWFNETGSPSNPYIEEGNAAGAFDAEAQAAFATAISDSHFMAGGTSVVNTTNFPAGTKPPLLFSSAQTLSVGKVPSSSTTRGVGIAGTGSAPLSSGKVPSSATAHGLTVAGTGSAPLIVAKIASSVVVRGLTLGQPIVLSVGKILSSATAHGVNIFRSWVSPQHNTGSTTLPPHNPHSTTLPPER